MCRSLHGSIPIRVLRTSQSHGLSVPDSPMTVDATDCVFVSGATHHQFVDEVSVALDAVLLKNPPVLLGDRDRLRKIL